MSTPLQAISGVANACQVTPTLVTGGQPGREHLEALKAAGVEVVLDIRDPMEPRPLGDEAAVAREIGLAYENVPVRQGAAGPAEMERILDVLRRNKGKQMFFHCGTANRVGGALIPYFMLDEGMSEDDAVQRAMQVGLRSPEFLEWGLDYARSHARE